MTAASQAAADGKLTRKEEREAAQALVAEIRRLAAEIGRPLRYMEVCGTHTVSIFRAGIRQRPGLPRLRHGRRLHGQTHRLCPSR